MIAVLGIHRAEIRDMLAAGMTRKAIAAALGVDVGTLRRYLARQ